VVYLRNDGGLLPAYTSKVLMEKPNVWAYGVSPLERQARLKVYTDALQRLADKGLTAAIVLANFNRRRVLPLMERELPLFRMTEEAPSEGTRMMAEPLSDEAAAQQAIRAVSQPTTNLGDFWRVAMRPDEGYIHVVSLVPKPRQKYCFPFRIRALFAGGAWLGVHLEPPTP
jgi:hypothetical protein